MGFGADVVRLARAAVESEILGGKVVMPGDPAFGESSGAFVTLNTYPEHDLRGCIGFPMPVLPLGKAIMEAARSACHDPRFPDLGEHELGGITMEVTVLTVPEPIEVGDRDELPSRVVIGRDGLIIDCRGRRGLLLPQVPVEWGWDSREFLSHLAIKAGLPPDTWKHPDARVSAFRGRVFSEVTPRGDITEDE